LIGAVAGLTAVLGSLVLGVRRAVLAGLVVTISPVMLGMGRVIMADVLVTAWVAGGLIFFAHYWRKPGWHTAIAFGLCMSGALLTKPAGAILALTPVICVLLTRRWELLREKSFWLPMLLAAAIYGPWHLAFREAITEGWRSPRSSWGKYVETPTINLVLLGRACGWVCMLAALYEICKRGLGGSRAVLVAAAVAAYVLFSLIVPVKALRHYTPLTPVLAVLAVGGLFSATRRRKPWVERVGAVALVGAVMAGANWQAPGDGVEGLVADLLESRAAPQIWLVAGSSEYEGDLIAEAALRRPTGGLTVYRSSKLFIDSDWRGRRSRPTVGSPEKARERLEQCGIEEVIIGQRAPAVVAEAVEGAPARWKIRRTKSKPEVGKVYERIGAARKDLGSPFMQKP
jgi:hypothetical protein